MDQKYALEYGLGKAMAWASSFGFQLLWARPKPLLGHHQWPGLAWLGFWLWARLGTSLVKHWLPAWVELILRFQIHNSDQGSEQCSSQDVAGYASPYVPCIPTIRQKWLKSPNLPWVHKDHDFHYTELYLCAKQVCDLYTITTVIPYCRME